MEKNQKTKDILKNVLALLQQKVNIVLESREASEPYEFCLNYAWREGVDSKNASDAEGVYFSATNDKERHLAMLELEKYTVRQFDKIGIDFLTGPYGFCKVLKRHDPWDSCYVLDVYNDKYHIIDNRYEIRSVQPDNLLTTLCFITVDSVLVVVDVIYFNNKMQYDKILYADLEIDLSKNELRGGELGLNFTLDRDLNVIKLALSADLMAKTKYQIEKKKCVIPLLELSLLD